MLAMIPATYAQSEVQSLFVGTSLGQNGIYACSIDLTTGEFGPSKPVADAPFPGFLALHPRLPLLYSISREEEQPTGGVRAFRIDSLQEPKLTAVGRQSTGDDGATHLALNANADALVVANYGGGSTTLLPLNSDGSLAPLSALVEHQGSSVNKQRQNEPHTHGVAFDKTGRFACLADLGTDEVIVYELVDGLGDGQSLERRSVWKAAPGAGPRHLAFHTNGRWLFCINELDSTMTVLEFDGSEGKLTEIQTLGTLPADYDQPSTTAEVVVHPSGKFVYGSNRGHDSTAAFAIDEATGQLTLIEIEPTQGGHPRFIGIEPGGNFLIAANRDANNLVSFRIDRDSGALEPTGHKVSIPKPICVVFPRPAR